jgi:hypothetical protein
LRASGRARNGCVVYLCDSSRICRCLWLCPCVQVGRGLGEPVRLHPCSLLHKSLSARICIHPFFSYFILENKLSSVFWNRSEQCMVTISEVQVPWGL